MRTVRAVGRGVVAGAAGFSWADGSTAAPHTEAATSSTWTLRKLTARIVQSSDSDLRLARTLRRWPAVRGGLHGAVHCAPVGSGQSDQAAAGVADRAGHRPGLAQNTAHARTRAAWPLAL